MLDSIITPSRMEKGPIKILLVGIVYASLSLLLVKLFFSADPVLYKFAGMIVVTFTVMFSLPFMYYLIKTEEEEDEKILFDYNKQLRIDVLLPTERNLSLDSITPKPITREHFNPHNDLPEPLNSEEESFLKDNECTIAQIDLNRKFKLVADMKVPLAVAKGFARIMTKHLKHQIDEYVKGIYSYTLPIEKSSPLEKNDKVS